MKKSGRFWTCGCLSAASLVLVAGFAPALADTASTGLLGDMGGVRSALGKYGANFFATDSENLLANLAGGVKTGATNQGVLTFGLEVDTGKALGLPGGTLHVTALQLHGRPISPYYLDNLQAANGNEGEDATRLWELWYDQQFLNNRLDLKIGQQSIDNEFMGSANSALFVNTMAGWPLIPSDDLYGGGPAYPLSSPGVRLQTEPTGSATLLAGVFDDNPGGGGFDDDAQQLDRGGTKFNLNTGALWIAELQYATKIAGLAGTYKFGGWYDSGTFPDRRTAAIHRGNYSLYGIADQTIWQSSTDNSRNLNIFGRIMGAPSDQNFIGFSFNGGITLAAPLPGRDNDTAGIDLGIGKVSSRTADADADADLPRQGTEELIELTYQATLTPWLVMQPDFQYIVNPGGGVSDFDNPNKNLDNELVVGARAVVTF